MRFFYISNGYHERILIAVYDKRRRQILIEHLKAVMSEVVSSCISYSIKMPLDLYVTQEFAPRVRAT